MRERAESSLTTQPHHIHSDIAIHWQHQLDISYPCGLSGGYVHPVLEVAIAFKPTFAEKLQVTNRGLRFPAYCRISLGNELDLPSEKRRQLTRATSTSNSMGVASTSRVLSTRDMLSSANLLPIESGKPLADNVISRPSNVSFSLSTFTGVNGTAG